MARQFMVHQKSTILSFSNNGCPDPSNDFPLACKASRIKVNIRPEGEGRELIDYIGI